MLVTPQWNPVFRLSDSFYCQATGLRLAAAQNIFNLVTVRQVYLSHVPKFPSRSPRARYYGIDALSIFKNGATTVHPELFKKLGSETKGGRWGTLGALATRQPSWLALARLLVPISEPTSDFSNHFVSQDTISYNATIPISDNGKSRIVCTRVVKSLGEVDALYLSHYTLRPPYPGERAPGTKWMLLFNEWN